MRKYNVSMLQASILGIRRSIYMRSYLNNQKQRVKFNDTLSSYENIIAGMLQASILGLHLFSIFPNNIFNFAKNSGLRR